MGDFPLLPESASTLSGSIDLLFFFLVALTIFFTGLVATLLVVFAIRYRRRSEDEVPEQITGSTLLEIGWSAPLLAIGLFVFFWGALLYFNIYDAPDDALEIYVIGKKWMWKYQHPDGQQEISDLHVPVGRPVKLVMTSQDVIHSYFVPAFRVKQDVLPGRYSTLWFEATKPGTYHLFCAEYCGTWHSNMGGSVIVMEEADYQEWLSGDVTAVGGGRATGTPAEQGEQLFGQLGCSGCHRMEGGGPGPSLVGIFGEPVQLASGETLTVDETYLRESILRPMEKVVAGYEPIMPTYQGQVNEEQLLNLIAYIKSLSDGQGEE